MAAQGPYTAGIPTPDGAASAQYSDSFSPYHVVDAYDFGFTIPLDATITDIYLESLNAAGFEDDYGANGGCSLSSLAGGGVATGSFGFYSSVGWTGQGGTGLWGVTWTPAQINDSSFGVSVGGNTGLVSAPPYTASEDGLRITVTYTPAAPPSAPGTVLSPVTVIGLGRRA